MYSHEFIKIFFLKRNKFNEGTGESKLPLSKVN